MRVLDMHLCTCHGEAVPTDNKCNNLHCLGGNASHTDGGSLAEEQPTTAVLAVARQPQQVANGNLVHFSTTISEAGGADYDALRGSSMEQPEGTIGATHSQGAVWRQTDRQTLCT